MFEKLIEKLESMRANRRSFDPSSLNDPLAMQTDWSPAKRGGASFQTHKLVTIDSNRLEFRASTGAKLFYLIFLLVGAGIFIGFGVYHLSLGEFSFNMAMLMPLLFGLIFTAVGVSMLYVGTTPIIFDKRNGFFWKGRKSPDEVFDKSSLKYIAELERTHALQLLSEYCQGHKSSYHSYELNLVLKNGKRINVVDHGSQDKLRDDAKTLSDFLKIPVWDAI